MLTNITTVILATLSFSMAITAFIWLWITGIRRGEHVNSNTVFAFLDLLLYLLFAEGDA